MKIFDCLLFFNEVEALTIRFHELRDVVDYHVIVEGTTTFSGQPRDIGFDATDPRWAPFIEKVIHVVVDDTPEAAGIWDREAFQRNAILRGLDMFQPDRSGPICNAQDLVLICDADEIPSAEAVRWVASRLVRGVAAFDLSFYYYHLNQLVCQATSGDTFDTYEPISWWLARAARRADIRWPQEVRDFPLYHCAHLASRGGWHFSYLGGVQRIQAKIAAFSHQELNHPQYTDAANIAGAIKSGRDLFGRDTFYRFQTVPVDNSFPSYVVENQELLANEIKALDKPASNNTLDTGAQSINLRVSGRPITKIIEATYGHGSDVVNVTAQLQERVRYGNLRLTVSNILFGDPCPNRVKTLRFTYQVAGDSWHHRHEVQENRTVSLGAMTMLLSNQDLPQPTDQ
jgi:beta-1,4-mannosyl-glycoprotein beta-1,4-N-acetylglucosaminyltransferase